MSEAPNIEASAGGLEFTGKHTSGVLKKYYSLTKPGVLYGNVITGAAGFLLAARGAINFALFVEVIVGMTLVIASACVLNNVLDRDIDARMERTKRRAAAAGAVAGYKAVIFSAVLGVAGFAVLLAFANWWVVGIGALGYATYVVLYGMWSKRTSVHGTLVGSLSGAAPVLAGYAAVSGTIDTGAILVFIALFAWQMPEFYSIAVYRRREYAAAKLPVVTVAKGVRPAIWQIFAYTLVFVLASLLLTPLGYTGITYFAVMLAFGGYWLKLAVDGLRSKEPEKWARKMFHVSLIALLLYSLMISISWLLP
jgi:protoheme IX farnesyltransferase